MLEISHAIVLDIDGVVIGNPLQPRLHGVAKRFLSTAADLNSAVNQEIKLGSQNPRDIVQNVSDRVLLAAVGRRKVPPGAKEHLDRISKYPIVVYGNTGRPDRQPWISATRKTLREGGVLGYFNGINFKPDGVSAEEGKIMHIKALLEQHEHVTVVDDNPFEAFAIANAFPDRVKVLIVQSLKGGVLFSGEENKRYPNVRRIASLMHLSPHEVLSYAN